MTQNWTHSEKRKYPQLSLLCLALSTRYVVVHLVIQHVVDGTLGCSPQKRNCFHLYLTSAI